MSTPNPRQRIVELMNSRREAYAQIEWHLDTTGKTVEQVAGEIIELLQPRETRVSVPGNMSPIFLGPGLLGQAGKLMNLTTDAFSPACAIVTDPVVRELFAPKLVESLRARGLAPHVIAIPESEEFKTLDSVSQVYDQLIDAQLDRHSIIFALGGGTVGDVAGFAAVTYLRGISLVQMPTTLLGMVDASIGGKVAVNLAQGKNLVGAFKQPYAVIADIDTLATLSPAEFRSGLAEVIKHAIIGDAELFEMLERDPHADPLSTPERRGWIARAMQVKIDIVARDPLEQDERGKLNLGHTFGHAFELVSGSELSHGEAVGIGLICAARLAARRQLCGPELAVRIRDLVAAVGLPTRVPSHITTDAILAAMATDKKRVGKQLRFVLPRALGDVVIVDDLPIAEVASVIEQARS